MRPLSRPQNNVSSPSGPTVRILAAFALVGLAACGVGQSGECEQYVACQDHYDTVRERSPTETNPYRPDGVCWENRELADECSFECSEEVLRLRELLIDSDDELGPCS